MVRSNHDIVCICVIMSPSRRLDDHDLKRTSLAPRSDPPALARPTPLRHLSRLEPRHFLVRQMVGRISTQSHHRLCRPLACSAALAPADACQCGAICAHSSSNARTGQHSPNPLRLDWRASDSNTPQAVAPLSLAQRTDHSAYSGPAPLDPPTWRCKHCGILSLGASLGRECDLRHRHHHQASARWSGNPELSYHRPLLARSLFESAPRQDHSYELPASAAQLGLLGAARSASIRQRRRVRGWPHPSACAWSSRALVPVLWRRAAVHAVLRTQAQLSDRKLSLAVGQRVLVAPPVWHALRGRRAKSTVPALVYVSLRATRALGPDPRATSTRRACAAAECQSAPIDPRGTLAADGGTASFSAQSRPQRCNRSVERSLAAWISVEWRVCACDDQHTRADTQLLAQGQCRERLAVDQNAPL